MSGEQRKEEVAPARRRGPCRQAALSECGGGWCLFVRGKEPPECGVGRRCGRFMSPDWKPLILFWSREEVLKMFCQEGESPGTECGRTIPGVVKGSRMMRLYVDGTLDKFVGLSLFFIHYKNDSPINAKTIQEDILFGVLDANEGLLHGVRNLIEKISLPALLATNNWGALSQAKQDTKEKQDFVETVNRYLSFLEGAIIKIEGAIELKKIDYIDFSELQSFEKRTAAAVDNLDVVHQLEEVLMIWYRQIEQLIKGKHRAFGNNEEEREKNTSAALRDDNSRSSDEEDLFKMKCKDMVTCFSHQLLDSLQKATQLSLNSLKKRIFVAAFLKVEVHLAIPNVVMVPSLDDIQQAINRMILLEVNCGVAKWGQRHLQKSSLKAESEGVEDVVLVRKLRNFYSGVAEHEDITKLVVLLSVNSVRVASEVLQDFQKYKMLWTEDRDAKIQEGPMVPSIPPQEASNRLRFFQFNFNELWRKYITYSSGEQLFGLPVTDYEVLHKVRKELGLLQKLYGLYDTVINNINGYYEILQTDVDIEKINAELLDFQNSFSLAQSGSWGCFDEFNQIELPVLSVAAQQIYIILTARKERKNQFIFSDGDCVDLNPEFGIFLTMNPGYAGRQELPENLKMQFRTVAVMVPDRMIIRVKLASYGFIDSVTLSQKFFVLYKLCEEQLTKQVHYDFGLRNILSVLRTRGPQKRARPNDSELSILMRGLRDMNLSKLIDEDEPLFLSLINDLFPGLDSSTYAELQAAVANQVEEAGLINHPPWNLKVVQLYETSTVCHGLMTLGRSGSGKTMVITISLRALTECGKPHREMRMNPKAITAPQMFGKLDATTNDWTDGIFSTLWRKTLKSKKGENVFLILDGPVDAIWIENLNSVLDDNKTLTLANGDRLPMSPTCKLLFEVHNIENASPATVSRMSMVYISSSALSWRRILQAWLEKLSSQEAEVLQSLYDRVFEPAYTYMKPNLYPKMELLECNYIMQSINLLEGLIPMKKEGGLSAISHLHKLFCFAMLWSLGALLELDSKDKLEAFIRAHDNELDLPEVSPGTSQTMYEFYVTYYGFNADNVIIISNFLKNSLRARVGLQDTVLRLENCIGMSVVNRRRGFLNDESEVKLLIKQENHWRTIESYVDKHIGSTHGPPGGRKMTIFIDDTNMPVINEWGDQTKMLPTPSKFHYIFKLDLSRIWQGMLTIKAEECNNSTILLTLFKHECTRVTADSFITSEGTAWFDKIISKAIEEYVDTSFTEILQGELYFVDFLREAPEPTGDEPEDFVFEPPKIYEEIPSFEFLCEKLQMYQRQYNECIRGLFLDLVFFKDAMTHLMKISRIIQTAYGNALLVGVGGSGKQSLSRLASFIAGYKIFQITLTRFYNASSLLDDLKFLYRTAGEGGQGITFIFTDNEIKEESFLEYINNLLSSCEISNLFGRDELDQITQVLIPMMKKEMSQCPPTFDNYEYFISRAKKNLHVVLCFSPVGEKFRAHSLKFPGLTSGCTMDWFSRWPKEALVAVSSYFLSEFNMVCSASVKTQIVETMGLFHDIVSKSCENYFQRYRRRAYVTPKSYLSFINGYKEVYTENLQSINEQAERMKIGKQNRDKRIFPCMVSNGLVICDLDHSPRLTIKPVDITTIRKLAKPPHLIMRIMDCCLSSYLLNSDLQKEFLNNSKLKLKNVTTLNDKYFRTCLEDSLSLGRSLMVEDIGEELDPVVDNILEKNFLKHGTSFKVKVGDKEVDIMSSFRLYITTKLPNPAFTPEINAKKSIIDFTVTMKGLENQLLGRVILTQKQELETEIELMEDVTFNRRKMKELEDNLLYKLSTTRGSLVDDESLMGVLQTTKQTAAEVAEKLSVAAETEVKINTAQEEYPAATRGSILYFLITEISMVNNMYQTSLAQFLKLFDESMAKSKKSSLPQKRISNIIEYLTFQIYSYSVRGLYENHKILFTFLLTLKIDLERGHVKTEFHALIRGGAALDLQACPPKPFRWILDMMWLNLVELSKLPQFAEILNQIAHNEKGWKSWFDKDAPEEEIIPDGYNDSLDIFCKLLLIRSWCPDRMLSQARKYIANSLHEKYTEPFILNLEKTWEESDTRTPLICFLSMGSDPTIQIDSLARKLKLECRTISMGQGQEVHAHKFIEMSMQQGGWVLLQNCHLGLDFMDELLETLLTAEIQAETFRVWITTAPHPKFPITLLQTAIKFTNEPPQGVRASLKRTFSRINQDLLDVSDMPMWKLLLYTVAFLHSTVQERRKFGLLGWNIPYEFNSSDFTASVQFIQNHLDECDIKKGISWTTVHYMIGEVQYGGQVTDDFDKHLLNCFGKVWFNEKMFDSTFCFYTGYKIPVCKPLEQYFEYIQSLPATDSPKVFGLHPNADITYQSNTAADVLDTITNIQPKERGAGAGESHEAIIYRLAEDMLEKLPPDYIPHEVKAHLIKMGALNSMNIFLRQEIARMQKVITILRSTLNDLKLAIEGTIVMSENLRDALDSMYDARIPQVWKRVSWDSSTLGFWFTELLERNTQFSTWIYEGRPNVFWMTGFFNPQGFLTAMRQEAARAHEGWALDTVTIHNVVLKQNKEEITAPPSEGVYIGLYLEGAGWDRRNSKLTESMPKILFVQMPVVHIFAVNTTGPKDSKLYVCPLYKKPRRTDLNYITVIYLRTVVSPDHWILRGVALLCDIK
ncbi:LOW QUALITY PROTEIN: dynein axonemal heavy chain 8 [Podargus strigoides]